jgi:hypothetical protein
LSSLAASGAPTTIVSPSRAAPPKDPTELNDSAGSALHVSGAEEAALAMAAIGSPSPTGLDRSPPQALAASVTAPTRTERRITA